jgi:hypothetical protein
LDNVKKKERERERERERKKERVGLENLQASTLESRINRVVDISTRC